MSDVLPGADPKEPTITVMFFGEARNRAESRCIAELAEGLEPKARVRCVSEGVITAYVVCLPSSSLPLLAGLDLSLKDIGVFGHVEIPFQPTINRVVEDLAIHTGSRLSPVDTCAVCGRLEPFPTEVMVLGEDGVRRPSDDVYCASCAAEIAASKASPARVRAEAR